MIYRASEGEELVMLGYTENYATETSGVGLVSYKNNRKNLCLKKFFIDKSKSDEVCM